MEVEDKSKYITKIKIISTNDGIFLRAEAYCVFVLFSLTFH